MSRLPIRTFVVGFTTASAMAISALVATPAAHAADLDCPDFSSQREAQIFFLNSGGPQSDPHRLDADGDGIACESNPAPYYYGTTPPSGGGGDTPAPAPPPEVTVVRSSVRLAISPSKRIAGEKFRVTISVRPRMSRDVVVQRKVDGRWRQFGSGTTGRNGVTYGDFKSSATSQTYRAVLRPVVRGRTRYTEAGSQPQTLRVEPQRVTLQVADRTIGEGTRVAAVVRATPVRTGRRIAVQVWTGAQWRTVQAGKLDRRGRARFTLAPALGRSSYRAVVLRSRGASSHSSRSISLVASDRTPPPAPFDLVAATSNGTITLSWSRNTPSDFDHDEVWLRTADTPWNLAYVPPATTLALENMQRGVTYFFTVFSVDKSGNRSAPAEVASVTLETLTEQTLRAG